MYTKGVYGPKNRSLLEEKNWLTFPTPHITHVLNNAIQQSRLPYVCCGQFHQHFMSSFCANILASKKYKPKP